ncbi:mitochondrial tRNA-specific 2-thiouridylase 1 [Episyrphus balteatus]|uniref:mitochondrial tRNA-specific 2-thiouridylase 1 n=1 Tax=Episyrphus balteatus TaxID=286459 RepID=UPI00248665A2|nr:mitochondrial tRNA-specific 2-thiouridylase 1 [Episyrphus balteatus]
MFRKVIVGVSGGVDSAVSAYLLKEKGFSVLGVFMRNWDELDETGRCSGEKELADATYVCNKIGIDLVEVNFVKEYWNNVFSNFLEDYQNGLTPNPDILCNRHIKFDHFYKHAVEKLDFDAIAMGHYARTSFGPYLENYNKNEEVRLLQAKDSFKDQTFFLSGIQQEALRKTMFPLGELTKSEVKDMAKKIGLRRVALKKESTGICFIGNRNFKNFIKEYIHSKPGDFIDIDTGKVVGQHEGFHQWTVGQRCRLHSFLRPYFVAAKDAETNSILVANGTDNPALFSNVIYTQQPSWISTNPLKDFNHLRCKFRFQHTKPLVDCTVEKASDKTGLIVTLDKPLRALTPGQYAVLYREDECLGSARIITSEQMQNNFKQFAKIQM